MRLTLDLDTQLPESYSLVNFCIYVAPQPSQLVVLSGNQTLQQVNEKFWKVKKVLFRKKSHFNKINSKTDTEFFFFSSNFRSTNPWKCIIHGKNLREESNTQKVFRMWGELDSEIFLTKFLQFFF